MWTQVVGKIRMALSPMVNHWWQVPLYVTWHGLTTSTINCGTRSFQIDFDFLGHELQISASTGAMRSFALQPMTVAQFYRQTTALLEELGVEVKIWPVPVEIPERIAFSNDHKHAAYDPEYAGRFWRILLQADRVFQEFRARFLGKVSPGHFFWGGFDLAVTRFSGRTAPQHPGGIPNVGDFVMREAYSHEVSSAGFWPGGGAIDEAAFYSYSYSYSYSYAYAYPEPPGFRDHPVEPEAAYYHAQLGEFILPYEAVRAAPNPDETLLRFLESTYVAAATLGKWERSALEREPAPR